MSGRNEGIRRSGSDLCRKVCSSDDRGLEVF